MGNKIKTLTALLKGHGISWVLFALMAGLVLYGLGHVETGNDQENLRLVEQSIARAIVSCYAIEGVYPESFAYLEEHYPLHIDTERYAVHYTVFASNIMPTVQVIEVGQ